jgi:hypothetical protein
MSREQLELGWAYLREIYACQAYLGCAGNCSRGWLGGPSWLFRTMLRVDDAVFLSGQRKTRAWVITHGGRRAQQLQRVGGDSSSVPLHPLHRQRFGRARHHNPWQCLAQFDGEILEFLKHMDHVLGQPTRGHAQTPAPSFRIANFLDEDRLLGRALAQKAESVRRRLCGWVDGHDRRSAEKGRRERAAGAVVFSLGWRRGKDAVEVEWILVVIAVCWW